MTNYARMDAKITKKNGRTFFYNVLEMLIKVDESERLETKDEVKDVFYEIVPEKERNAWDYARIDLEYEWGKEKVTATIYG